MNDGPTFGQVVKERRGALGLTQTELARRANCAAITIRKIEADALRPSVQMAELIAIALKIPEEEQLAFVRLARSERDPSPIPTPSPTPGEIGRTDLTGRAVKGFQLGEKIGSGGFGVVYRAVQPSVQRDVAVKIILPRYANHPGFIRRFEAEAQLIARLEHPHIVPLYDYWREPDAAYLIMRLLRGGNLESQIEKGPLPIDLACRYLRQIGSALDVAHRSGVVHRDIKPANVLLDEETNVYLADFGIAKNLDAINNQSLTDDGALVGSPPYVSPEQILAEPVKPQSDIYLLGLLLFEMLTGQKPFPGPTPIASIQQHLAGDFPSLLSLQPQYPKELEVVIRTAAARESSDRYKDVPSLLSAIQQTLAPISAQFAGLPELAPMAMTDEELAALENPYIGLRAFTEADAEQFHGRDTLIQELFSKLSESSELARFLALVGPSGSGKSSAIKAGLVPALRRGALPDSDSWFILDFAPGAHPWEEVEAALLRVAVNPPETLLNQLQEGERGLLRAVRRVLPDDGRTELVLIIDQFEELFTMVEDEAVREQFLNSLIAAVMDEHSRLRVIITLRADFYDRPLQYVDFGDLMRQRTVSVLPMTPDELEQAITEPAVGRGMIFEPGLTAAIIRDVGDQPGTLPLLQYVLTELFDRRERNILSLRAYVEVGGVTGALARRADDIYGGLDTSGQVTARQIFLRLITLGEGVEDTRRRVRISEIESLSIPVSTEPDSEAMANNIRPLIDSYGRYRLLTFDHDPITREPTVEVAHEALLREWSLLRAWLDESRANLRIQRQLSRATNEWDVAMRDASFLIPGGAKLDQFVIWRQESGLALTPLEEEYLSTSLAVVKEQAEYEMRQVRTRRNLRRGLVAALVVGLIVASGLAIFAFNQQRIAKEQRQEAFRQASIGLAALAESELDGVNRDLGVLLALEAVEHYPFTPQAVGALARSIEEYRSFRILDSSASVADLIQVATWSPDGDRIAGSSSKSPNSVVIWDAVTGVELLSINSHGDLCQEDFNLMHDLTWSPSGQWLAVAAQDPDSGEGCGVVIFDSRSGEILTVVASGESAARSIDWSSDGRTIMTGHEDGAIRVWDTLTGSKQATLSRHTGVVRDVATSPDGDRMATASEDGSIRLWNIDTGTEQMALYGHAGPVRSVDWSPDGDRLVSGGNDGLPRVWDLVSGDTLFALPGHIEDVVIVTWSADGRRIASQSLDAVVKIWDAATGGLLYQIPNAAPDPATKRGFVEFSPDGRWILVGGSRVLGLRIWEASISTPKLFGHTFGQEWGGWSPDGTLIATSGEDGSARLWDAETGQQLRTFELGSFWGAWSPDGTRLAFADGIGAHTLSVWDVESGERIATLAAPDDEYGSHQFLTMNWSPDSKMVAAADFRPGTPQPIYVWDADTTDLEFTIHTDDACHLGWPRWSPDGSRIAGGCIFVESGINTPIRIWDAVDGQELMTLDSDYGWSYRAIWSPDGTRLLATYENGAAEIWDTVSGKSVLTFTGHQGPVDGEWSPDGVLIASTDFSEQVVKIWESESGDELFSFSVPGAPLTIGWSPDGSQIIVTGDGLNEPVIKRIWQSTDELVAHAIECCVTRELTSEERDQFGLPDRP